MLRRPHPPTQLFVAAMLCSLCVSCGRKGPPSATPPKSLVAYALHATCESAAEENQVVAREPFDVTGKLWSEEKPKSELHIKAIVIRANGSVSTAQSGSAVVSDEKNDRYSYTATLNPIRKPGHYILQVKYRKTVIDEATFEVVAAQ